MRGYNGLVAGGGVYRTGDGGEGEKKACKMHAHMCNRQITCTRQKQSQSERFKHLNPVSGSLSFAWGHEGERVILTEGDYLAKLACDHVPCLLLVRECVHPFRMQRVQLSVRIFSLVSHFCLVVPKCQITQLISSACLHHMYPFNKDYAIRVLCYMLWRLIIKIK
jgi:hypothetical protein